MQILKGYKTCKIKYGSISQLNPNNEEQIVQAMAGVLAYNLDENDENIKFDYNNSNTYQNSHKEIEDEIEL